jgi:hypothetical protein
MINQYLNDDVGDEKMKMEKEVEVRSMFQYPLVNLE